MIKRPQPHDVEINLTGLREQIVRQFFDAIRPLVRAFDDIDAAERILGGTTADIAAHAKLSTNGNGHRKLPAADNLKQKLEEAIPAVVEAGTTRTGAIRAALPSPLNRAHNSTFQAAMRNLVTSGTLQRNGLGSYAIGNGTAPAKKRRPTNTPRQDGKTFQGFVLAAVADAPKEGLSTAEVCDRIQDAGYRFPPNKKHRPGTVTSWALQSLFKRGRVRKLGEGHDRRFVPVLPKLKVTKGE